MLTSNIDLSELPPQKPLTEISSLALLSLMTVARFRCSPESGWSLGSIHTSMQTSDSSWAVKSLTSLCLKPPLVQEIACSTVKWIHIHNLRAG